MSTTEVLDSIKGSVKVNATEIDKVVIILSGRVEKGHEESIGDILGWLKMDKYPENLCLMYTKCEDMSDNDQYTTLLSMIILYIVYV